MELKCSECQCMGCKPLNDICEFNCNSDYLFCEDIENNNWGAPIKDCPDRSN